jgi:hypothetical protein
MTISQSNYLNMSNAVLTHFDNNVPAWSGTGIVSKGVGRLRDTIMDITGTATKQDENNPVGHTVAKERSRDGLEGLVFLTALRVRSYAGAADDDVLLEKMRFSRSSLDTLGTNVLLTRSRMVLDACVANLPALTDYQIDQKTIDELQQRIDRTALLYAQRDTIIDRRMEATAHLQQLFTQARKQLKTLDDLVEGYVEDNVFMATYFNARRIHDLRGRKAKTEETE